MNHLISQQTPEDSPCRLCGGAVHHQFTLRVLGKYLVEYRRCEQCNSLQTEVPFWIAEAYSSHLALLDTGAAQRSLTNLAAAYCVSRILRLNDVIDFGGGDGLLCRLLRDYDINCFVHDKHAAATYAQGFDTPDFSKPGIVLAFEVMEHFADPARELSNLFDVAPNAILVSTLVYSDQGPDWWYLAPESGQHVFFYSDKALRRIAKHYEYSYFAFGNYSLFVKPQLAASARLILLRALLNGYSLRLVSAGMRLLPTPGVWKDFSERGARQK